MVSMNTFIARVWAYTTRPNDW